MLPGQFGAPGFLVHDLLLRRDLARIGGAAGQPVRDFVAWDRVGLHMRIAVNVSVVQLHRHDFVDQVRAALAQSGLPPHCLELEITEGAVVSNLTDALDKLHELKSGNPGTRTSPRCVRTTQQ